MNPKLIKYRDEILNKDYSLIRVDEYEKETGDFHGYQDYINEVNVHRDKFIAGFSAAIQLNLAVEFAEWKDHSCYNVDSGWMISGNLGVYTNAELFDYFLSNIWTDKK